MPYRSLSEPLITLAISPSRREEAEQAFAILRDAEVGFRVIAGTNDAPVAEYAGEPYIGLTRITLLVETLLSYREVLRQGVDSHFGSLRNDRVQAEAERALADQLDAARRAFMAILAVEQVA